MVDVGDVAAAHIAAADSPESKGRYMLVGGCPYWSEVVDAIRGVEGLPDKLKAALPTEKADPETEPKWRYNQKPQLTCDCTKATKELGITLRSPLESVRELCADDKVFLKLVEGAE